MTPDTSADEKNVLVQTLMSVFDDEESAQFAADQLANEAHLPVRQTTLIAPRMPQHGRSLLHANLPDAYWEDGEQALQSGRVLLIATVDEVDAFRARELLEEETQSQRTLVLPPEPDRSPRSARPAQKPAARTGRESPRQDKQAPGRAAHLSADAT